MEDVIRVEGLTKAFGGRVAVRDLSIRVRRGTAFGLLGANGAGKSTSVACMLGVRRPDGGEISLLGMDPRRDRRRLFERVGVQFQEAQFQREIRVDELCRETAALYRHPADWRGLLAQFGLAGREHTPVRALSGGQRQRLFVALALIPDPQLVFLDELTTGLDVQARREVWQILRGRRERGLTLLVTSHSMEEVEQLCDEICILRQGRTAFQGTPAQAVANSPFDRFEDAYLWYAEGEAVR